jgi:predicted HTH domain antitoxin
MAVRLEIPDAVVQAMRLPEQERASRLLEELALALYAQGILSFGKARELAGLDKYEFGKLLGERSIPRHYTAEELQDDVNYASGE